MALSRVEYTGNGDETQFSIPFPYLDKTHIKVRVEGEEVSFEFESDSIVNLDVAPAYGDVVEIIRDSDPEKRLVDYNDKSLLRAVDLDTEGKHFLYLFQERVDLEKRTLLPDHNGNLDAGERRLRNIGYPKDISDVVTLEYLDDEIVPEVEATENYRDDAYHWANADEDEEVTDSDGITGYSAYHHKLKADDARHEAKDAASDAEYYQDQAKTHRNAANDHRNDAESAKNSAKDSRDTAEVYKDSAKDAELEAKSYKEKAEDAELEAKGAEYRAKEARDDTEDYRNEVQGYRDDAEVIRDDVQEEATSAQEMIANAGSMLGINFGAFWIKDGELHVTHLSTSQPKLENGELILEYETLETDPPE